MTRAEARAVLECYQRFFWKFCPDPWAYFGGIDLRVLDKGTEELERLLSDDE